MSNKLEIDISDWKRKEHFYFFSNFDDPYFGITTEVNVNKAWEITKANQSSFFIYYLHKSLMALNEIDEFKYRIEKQKVFSYSKINASATIARPDRTFGFSFIEYVEDFQKFSQLAQSEIKAVQISSGIGLNEDTSRLDTVHFSSVPWFSFSSVSHAKDFKRKDSVPKISFGKAQKKEGEMWLSISIHAHHGLIDGYHISEFLEKFQHHLNT